MSLWTLDEVIAATGGRAVGVSASAFGSVSIDSREIALDALFVAIKGDRVDGHDYVDKALAAGAGAALVAESRATGLPQDRLIVVPDALQGMRDLAAAARARSTATIVAVTGSAGKTTTKEMIRYVLARAGRTHYSIKSFNNHWGVPLMLARLPRDAEFGVFELGMNHAGEIEPLSRLVRPHVAVITTVAAAHLEFFDSVAGIARAKAEIFTGLEPGGKAILNADHDQIELLLDEAKRIGVAHVDTYGFDPQASWNIALFEQQDGYATLQVRHGDRTVGFEMPIEGRHMAANAAGTFAVASALGIQIKTVIEGLRDFQPPEGRGATLLLGPADNPVVVLDQSYNANSASMEAVLAVFARHRAKGRKVLVLGEMLELGAEGPGLHAALKGAVLAAQPDSIFLVGNQIAALGEALGKDRVTALVARVDDIIAPVLDSLAYGDTIMIKGSNGVGLAGLVKKIRERFA